MMGDDLPEGSLAVDPERHRTAIARTSLSRPMARALDDGVITPSTSVFDYGCGRGGDLQRLIALGFQASGWDPAHLPHAERRPADVVNLGYVVNVIEDPLERAQTLRSAWDLAKTVLIVAARPDWEGRSVSGRRYGDGIITAKGTFQRFYSQDELRGWIDAELGVQSVAAAPGIFYVFRDDVRAQSLLAGRIRHRPTPVHRPHTSEALFEANRDVLEPLIAFVETRGRPPEPFELAEAAAIRERFGSIKAAVAIVRRAGGDGDWQAAQAAAKDDLLVYLALAAFRRRPKLRELTPDVQIDVKTFFGSYTEACTSADSLLFRAGDQAAVQQACRGSPIGKLTPEALYVHTSAVGQLGPLLRVYEGCGQALAGVVEEATIVKLNHVEPKVSYLAYPEFDRDPHPALATSVRADLRRLDLKYRDFRNSANPPILHRKETLVPPDYPRREEFARLTTQEEELGLFSDTAAIGTREKWKACLLEKHVQIVDHELISTVEPADSTSDTAEEHTTVLSKSRLLNE